MIIPPSVGDKIRAAITERGIKAPPAEVFAHLEDLDDNPELGRPAIGLGEGVLVYSFKIIRDPVTLQMWVAYRREITSDGGDTIRLVDFGHEPRPR